MKDKCEVHPQGNASGTEPEPAATRPDAHPANPNATPQRKWLKAPVPSAGPVAAEIAATQRKRRKRFVL
jgi:hypothetical protein